MRKLTYTAVFEPAEQGFSVYFPDLLGCTSFGDTLEEAKTNAAEALGMHLYYMEQDGDPIPAPSAEPEIDPETEPGYQLVPITVFPDLVRNELDNKRMKTNVTLPAWLKRVAEDRNVNYSRLLEVALLEYLNISPRA